MSKTTTRPLMRLLAAAKRVSGALAERRAQALALEPIAQAVPDSADVFAADELPPVADIEADAAQFFRASEQARAADRTKRASRKLLERLPAGRYGVWQIERVANARETADLDAIRAVFKANGLGPVPMKACAPSLKVSRVALDCEPEQVEAELHALAVAA
jgi:hypothetical protein